VLVSKLIKSLSVPPNAYSTAPWRVDIIDKTPRDLGNIVYGRFILIKIGMGNIPGQEIT